MISQDAITYNVRNLGEDRAQLNYFEERFITYLPLSHIAGQMIDIFCSLYFGATTYFAQPDALKGSLNLTLQQVRPTFFFAVPRVLEKIQEKMEITINSLTGSKLKLLTWAREVTYEHITTSFIGNTSKCNISYAIAKVLILNKIYKQLGLDKAVLRLFSGAAPISKETLDFFIR